MAREPNKRPPSYGELLLDYHRLQGRYHRVRAASLGIVILFGLYVIWLLVTLPNGCLP